MIEYLTQEAGNTNVWSCGGAGTLPPPLARELSVQPFWPPIVVEGWAAGAIVHHLCDKRIICRRAALYYLRALAKTNRNTYCKHNLRFACVFFVVFMISMVVNYPQIAN